MSPEIHLAVDAMGGDLGPRLTVPASLAFLQQHPDSRISLVGDADLIEPLLQRKHAAVTVVHAPDAVQSDDRPSYALRHRRQSSLWLSLDLLAEGRADACVSAGNTGALMAMSKHLIGTFAGVERPAICKPVPTREGFSFLLDLGANLNCNAEHLVQFAFMGACLARSSGIERPRVGLLNVGSEEYKGGAAIQTAAARLQQLQGIDYIGFVEGDGVYVGAADVVVCDGFAGNVALKVSEGVARLLFGALEQRLADGWQARFARRLLAPALASWQRQFSPSRYNGAALLGLTRPVIKSHGGADLEGFCQALATAREQVHAELTSNLEQELAAATKIS